MEKEFVPYELALKMKQLGFDEPCFGAHAAWGFMSSNDVNSLSDNVTQEDLDNQAYLEEDGVCLAPLYQQAFRWFREKYFIHGEPKYKGGLTKETAWYDYIIISNIDWDDSKIKNKQYKTYEEAELACLEKLIEIVENNLVD